MSAPKTRDPLAVTTRDGMSWVRRAVTQDGHGLYAPEGVCNCPERVMATLAELAEHGIKGRDPLADAVAAMGALPVPLGHAEEQPFVPRTERSYWQDIADALNAATAAGMPIGIDLDGTLTDRNAWSVVWDCAAERWTLAGYDDEAEHAAEVANLRVMYDVVSQREHDLIEERDALLTRVAELEAAAACTEFAVRLTADALDVRLHSTNRKFVEEQLAYLRGSYPDARLVQFDTRHGAWTDVPVVASCLGCGEGLDDENISDFCSDRCAEAGSNRPVDEDPIAYSLTVEALHASSGAVIETPSRREQSTAKLRGILARQQAAVEAAHETPPRPRPTPHDLPEVTP